MTQKHGKGTIVLYDGYNLSGDFNSINRNTSVDTADVSTFLDNDHEFLAGLINGTLDWNFIYSDATPNLETRVATDFGNDPKAAMIIPSNTVLKRAFATDKAIISAFNIGSSISDAVKGSGNMQSSGPLRSGTLLHELVLEQTTPGTGSTFQEAYGSISITSSSVANPTTITTPSPHNLRTGDVIVITGHTGSTPSINGTSYTVTVVTDTTFTIPVNVTVGGTGGTAKKLASLGGILFIHCTGVTGSTPSLTPVLMDSADGSSWASHTTAAAITAAGTQAVTVPGTIREYKRLEWTITGTSSPGATFAALYVPNPFV